MSAKLFNVFPSISTKLLRTRSCCIRHTAPLNQSFHTLRTQSPRILHLSHGTYGIRQFRRLPVKTIDDRSGGLRLLFKPFCFTILMSGGSFGVCSIWQYETLRGVVRDAMKGAKGYTSQFYGKAGGLRNQLNRWWNTLNSGERLVSGIIACNVAAYLLWRNPRASGFMMKYFSSSPFSGAPCWSMLFSTFSHYSFWHLAANMYVLWSFSGTIVSLLGREQFLAMYISGGLISSFASHLNKVPRGSRVTSLGASGAIMAVLGAVCTHYPDAQLGIAFIGEIFPHSFSAASAQKFLIVMDTCGVVFGWRFFDHAAHLGGMLFGMWYIKYGHQMIWGNRDAFLKWWHKVRGNET